MGHIHRRGSYSATSLDIATPLRDPDTSDRRQVGRTRSGMTNTWVRGLSRKSFAASGDLVAITGQVEGAQDR